MRHLIHLFILGVSFYIYACANQGTPTGGPRDTIPPLLTESEPANKSTNYRSKEFKFNFSERVNADKLKSQLLITPHIENKYKVKVRKNELTLTFDKAFNDNTTYTLNFSEGLVDVTEKNPAVNLSFAFSTGPIIDSIYVNGKITDLNTNKSQEAFMVGLYLLTDTLDLFKDKPRYFAKTNENGQFQIENIKDGYYKILTFNDVNRNLVLNPETESHGFLSDSLNLTTSQDSIFIRTNKVNATELKFIRSKTTSRYFDLQYNKGVKEYKLTKLDSTESLPIPPHNLVKDDKILRFYPIDEFKPVNDSLAIIASALDSLSNVTKDTAYVKFNETSRKPDKFEYNLTPSSSSFIDQNIKNVFTFNKPIQTFYLDSILFAYDTLKYQSIADTTVSWNETKTRLIIETQLDKSFLQSKIDTLVSQMSDSTITDSTTLARKQYYTQVKTNSINLKIPKGTFSSVENDSTDAFNYSYTFKSLDQMGSVSGQITSNYKSFILQLVDTKYEVLEESVNTMSFKFPYVKPGKYTFRVLIDEDEDGQWSSGNILQDKEPEPVYFYSEIFDVRANWQLENIQISF